MATTSSRALPQVRSQFDTRVNVHKMSCCATAPCRGAGKQSSAFWLYAPRSILYELDVLQLCENFIHVHRNPLNQLLAAG
jgi:hypothetical protein